MENTMSKQGIGSFDQLPSGKWRFRVTVHDEGGFTQRKSFTADNKRLCQIAYDNWMSSEHKVAIERVTTLKEWSTHWLESYCKPIVSFQTYTDYMALLNNHILPYSFSKSSKGEAKTLASMKLTDIRPAHIHQFFSELETQKGTPVSWSTRQKCRIVLSKLFSTAKQNGLCQTNPVENYKMPKKPERQIVVFTPKQLEGLLMAFECSESGRYIALLLHTGMRLGELLGLTWANIDQTNRLIHVSQALRRTEHGEIVTPGTKTNTRRNIPYDDYVQLILDKIAKNGEYVVSRKRNDGYTHHTHASFNTIYEEFFDTINMFLDEPIPKLSPHKCRHTFATYLLQSDVDIRYIQQILGHSNITTTEWYTHPDEDAIRKSIHKLSFSHDQPMTTHKDNDNKQEK
jgi:integrase